MEVRVGLPPWVGLNAWGSIFYVGGWVCMCECLKRGGGGRGGLCSFSHHSILPKLAWPANTRMDLAEYPREIWLRYRVPPPPLGEGERVVSYL